MSVSRFLAWTWLGIASIAIWACNAVWGPTAHAQEVAVGTANTQELSNLDPLLKPAHHKIESPERFFFELKGGPYKLFNGTKWDVFGADSGLSWAAQLDVIAFRLPKTLYITAGGTLGSANYAANAIAETGQPATEQTTLSLVPVIGTVGVRVDALPRRFKVPIILTVRIGWDWTHWDTNTGKLDDASGWSIGPYISGQVALDLDTFEPGGARALDEEWGINHTYVFAELAHYETTKKSLPIGGTSYMLGLGLAF
jgi:hypothetical protein